MTRDDIIKLALEAGINVEQGFLLRFAGVEDDLDRFAALVAAAEREACARVCEEVERKATHQPPMVGQGCQACAVAIRARGQA